MDFFNKLKTTLKQLHLNYLYSNNLTNLELVKLESLFNSSKNYTKNYLLNQFYSNLKHIGQTLIFEDLRSDYNTTNAPNFNLANAADNDYSQYENECEFGPCLEMFYKKQMLIQLVDMGVDHPELRLSVINLCINLLNYLNDNFINSVNIHRPINKIIKEYKTNHNDTNRFINNNELKYKEKLVELMLCLCLKIYANPELLNLFFYSSNMNNKNYANNSNDVTLEINSDENVLKNNNELSLLIANIYNMEENQNENSDYECTLFHSLIQYIHEEGACGTNARSAIQILIELNNDLFLNYIVERTDFIPILSAGLGALYSQLPQNVESTSLNEYGTNTIYISYNDNTVSVNSYLKVVEFCDNIIEKCKYKKLKVCLLKSIVEVFLENILYPSMLESSRVDGSALSFCKYLNAVIIQLKDGYLLQTLLKYLINNDTNVSHLPLSINNETSIEEHDSNSPFEQNYKTLNLNFERTKWLAFDLKDFVINNLSSRSNNLIISCLELLITIFLKAQKFSLSFLTFENLEDNQKFCYQCSTCTNTIYSHRSTFSFYTRFISKIDQLFPKNKMYDFQPYIVSADISIRNQIQTYNKNSNKNKLCLKINPKDPLMNTLIELYKTFLENSSELNLKLTQFIAGLLLNVNIDINSYISTLQENNNLTESSLSSKSSTVIEEPIEFEPKSIFDLTKIGETINEFDLCKDQNAISFKKPMLISVLMNLIRRVDTEPELIEYFAKRCEVINLKANKVLSSNDSSKAIYGSNHKLNEAFVPIISAQDVDSMSHSSKNIVYTDNINSEKQDLVSSEILRIYTPTADNLIILCESIKEILSILQVRRAYGIDAIKF